MTKKVYIFVFHFMCLLIIMSPPVREDGRFFVCIVT